MKTTEEITAKQAMELYRDGPQPFIEMQVQRATWQAVEDEKTGVACVYRVEWNFKTKTWGKVEFRGFGSPTAAALKLVQLANAEWTAQKKYTANKAKEAKQAERAVEQAKKAEAKRVAKQIADEKAATEKAAELEAKKAAKHHDASNVQKQIKKVAKPTQALKLHQTNGKAPQAAKAKQQKQRRAMAS
jgi:hypothetical protein